MVQSRRFRQGACDCPGAPFQAAATAGTVAAACPDVVEEYDRFSASRAARSRGSANRRSGSTQAGTGHAFASSDGLERPLRKIAAGVARATATVERDGVFFESSSRSRFLFAHGLFGEPPHTLR